MSNKINGSKNNRDAQGEHLYLCDGCDRYFLPGDTCVTENDGEFCYEDTGNGCYEQRLGKLFDNCGRHILEPYSSGVAKALFGGGMQD